MLEFYNVKVHNLREAIISCRNAVRTELAEHTDKEFEKSLERAIKLSKLGGGSGHTSFRKGILVSFDMKYTQYITKQLQRYHWFEYDSSTSMMHRITKMDFSKCCNKYVLDETKLMMQRLINEYQESPSYEKFMYVISNCPMGTELYVHVTTSYEQLATMYKQRKNHKLKEDYGNFCAMVESLPYAKELILGIENTINMELRLRRIELKKEYTIGKLYIDGEYFCDTIEDCDRGLTSNMTENEVLSKKIYAKTAIPTGIYEIDLYTQSPRYKDNNFYKKVCNGYLPRLKNVLGFSGVLIHCGNTAKDSSGCCIVGYRAQNGYIYDSQKAFTNLWNNYLAKAKANKKSVYLNISYD